MTSPVQDGPRRGPRGVPGAVGAACACALVAFVAYRLLAQEVFYKVDGPYLVLRLVHGDVGHPYNALYMPLLAGLASVAGPAGLTPYQTAMLLSALGAAAGVFWVHLAFRTAGMPRADALWATALGATSPPVWFFATVVEHHGPLFAAAGFAYWVTVRFARAPTLAWALALGAATHLAFAVHGTGNLLPALLLPTFLAWRWRAGHRRRDALLATAALALHVALLFALLPIEIPGYTKGALLDLLWTGIGRPKDLAYLPAVTWQEWLRPFLPLSVIWLAAFALPRRRGEALAMLCGLVPFVALCQLLIVGEDERGAYLLPLAIPAARLTALALPRAAVAAACGLSIALALSAILLHGDPAAGRAFARGLGAELQKAPATLLVGGTEDIGRCLIHFPGLEFHSAREVISNLGAAEGRPDGGLVGFDRAVELGRALGAPLLLTDDGWRAFDGADGSFGARLRAHVETVLRPRRVDSDGFRGWRFD